MLQHLLLLAFTSVTTSFSTLQESVISYAALGDSYASGDGAGSSKLLPNFDITCGRFSDAYPVQIANSTDLDIGNDLFRNIACGGASTTTVLRTQAPRIGDSQIVSLTVGGNEVDFFVLLNECVQQWRPSSSCETQISRSRSLIESSAFIANYGDMVRGVSNRLERGARLLVTGYSTFFNEETDQCDHISFSRTDPSNLLTKSLRKGFNDLVRLLNDVISSTCAANDVEFVDLDTVFEGHRFCEEGVVEPSNRTETWFFNINYDRYNGASASQPLAGQTSLQNLPKPIEDFFDLTRTFHPTGLGHKAIAEEITRRILQRSLLMKQITT